jgi:uncharacterized protein (TIGR02453 family)
MTSPIRPALFQFLRELKTHNDRDWFEANKRRYEQDVKEPLLDFIADFAPMLQDISMEYLAIPKSTGGSLFRIYRDTRFANDKTPYKTHAAMQFRHSMGKDVHAPGFYLHLEPGEVFLACGLWRPESSALLRIRTAIANDPDTWSGILQDPVFSARFKQEGESLKRPPQGFDPDHPLIDELRRKDFIATATLSEDAACSPDFVEQVADAYRPAGPYMEFLTTSLGLPW